MMSSETLLFMSYWATHTVDPSVSPAEQMAYFGWVWEESAAQGVQMAMRLDDAKVDLGLWNVGGDGEGLEEARGGVDSGAVAPPMGSDANSLGWSMVCESDVC